MKLTIVHCEKCGKEVAPILARLGSVLCHDHRAPGNVSHTLSGR